jgi:hypothetical protein
LLTENSTQNDIRVCSHDWSGSAKEIKGICLPEVFATLSIEFLMRKWRILYTTVANAHQIGKKKKKRNTFQKFATSSWSATGYAPCNYKQRQ